MLNCKTYFMILLFWKEKFHQWIYCNASYC